jgi:preprotein translocase subunit SecG
VSAPLNRIADSFEKGIAKTEESLRGVDRLTAWLVVLAIALVIVVAILIRHKLHEEDRHAKHSRGGPTGGTEAGP